MEDKIIGNIYITEDYDKFKMIKGNRIVDFNDNDYKSLKNSIVENGQLIPGVVDNKMRIIDGQHRLMVCASENIPFKYIIVDDEKLPNLSIQVINTISKKWTKLDYLNYHVKLGNKNYQLINKLCEEYPEISLSNILSATRTNSGKLFDIGEAIVTDMDVDMARYIFDCIREIKGLFKYYKNRSFISAYIKCLSTEGFVHETFIKKLKNRRLEKQPSIKEYLREIEDIYNFSVSKENRIRLY